MAAQKAPLMAAEEISVDQLPKDFAQALTQGYGEFKNRLLKTQDGVTCFDVREPENVPSPRKICVLSHGLGGSLALWEQFGYPEKLTALGYTVVMWSFFGHHWSYASEEVLSPGFKYGYTKSVFLGQAKAVLSHVLKQDEVIDVWIGHSTGGLLGGMVDMSGTWKIKTLALCGAAFWTSPTCVSKLLMTFHPCSTACLANCSEGVAKDEYRLTVDNAFGKRDLSDKEHIFEEKCQKRLADVDKMLSFHPQIGRAIFSIGTMFLRQQAVIEMRLAFLKYLQTEADTCTSIFFWGEYDIVVPFKEGSPTLVAMKNPKARLHTLKGLAHEFFMEDSEQSFDIIKAECALG